METNASYDRTRRAAEDRLRRNMAAAKVHPDVPLLKTREAMEAFEARLQEIDRAVDAVGAEVSGTIAEAVGGPGATAEARAESAAHLPVRALHKLDAAGAELRHSIAQAALGSLRMMLQQLPAKRSDSAFLDKLKVSFGRVETARGQTAAFFKYMPAPGVSVSALFPEEHRRVNEAFAALDLHAAPARWPVASAEECQAFAERMVQVIDSIPRELDSIRTRVDARRIPLTEVLAEAVECHAALARERGVEIIYDSAHEGETLRGEEVKIFADRKALVNAFGELIHNACRHAFPEGRGGQRQVRVAVDASSDPDGVIAVVADTGVGMSEESLHRLGMARPATGGGYGWPMVRRIIEVEHLGKLAVTSDPGKGTRVEARFPRRMRDCLEGDL